MAISLGLRTVFRGSSRMVTVATTTSGRRPRRSLPATQHYRENTTVVLGTRLDWVAVDHWNTDNPHTHVVLRGKDDTGKDLVISRDYIAEGMRHRAAELATEWLGPRTELEIQRAMQREVDQERWTGLDRTLQRLAMDGLVGPERLA